MATDSLNRITITGAFNPPREVDATLRVAVNSFSDCGRQS